MADVTSGSGWIGAPTQSGTTQRRSPEAAAFGIGPDEVQRRRQQTGVDAGGAGYVSGQAPPAGNAMAALGATPQLPVGSVPRDPGLSGPVTPPASPGAGQAPGYMPPGGDTTTVSSALSTGAPGQAPMRGPQPAAVADQTTTRTGALTQPGTAGTTQGQVPIPTGGRASPTVNVLNRISPGLGDKLDPGSKLVENYLKPTLTDTRPGEAAQTAAFGTSDALDAERYAYRPGAAASQDRIALEKAQQEELRQRQIAALGGLNAAANGLVPSAAELQMRREAGKNVAATLGQARALGGRSAGGAARAGTLATADILANNAASGAQLRAAEQAQARNAEIQALGGVRGQDVDVAGQDARLAQEANANNLRAQLEQNELAERHRQALLQGQLQALGIGTGAATGIMNAGAANAAAQNKFQGGVLGTIGSAFGI